MTWFSLDIATTLIGVLVGIVFFFDGWKRNPRMKSEEQQSHNAKDAVEKQLREAIDEVHDRSPQGQEYDRDKVRQIAEEYTRKYVTLVRRKSNEESAAT